MAYLIGSIPFGLILAKAAGAGDVRQIGSGNIGATNVLRTGRKGLALATLVLDMLKGALPAGLAFHSLRAGHGGGRRARRGARPLLPGLAQVPGAARGWRQRPAWSWR